MESKTNIDVLTTRAADGIAVITLGSAKRIYFDAEMGDALTEALDGFAGDPNVHVVIVTGGALGYFNRHFSIPALIQNRGIPARFRSPVVRERHLHRRILR
jgi:enoyl-CoA hydratase/carnithine racemase